MIIYMSTIKKSTQLKLQFMIEVLRYVIYIFEYIN